MPQRSHSCLPNILPRAAKQNGTILIRVFFKDGHHEDKTFAVFKPENAGGCIIGSRAQDCAQPRNTWVPSTQSSRPETKHSSAFAGSAVSTNESKCKLS